MKIKKQIISISLFLFGLICFYLFFKTLNWKQIINEFSEIHPKYFIYLILASLGGHIARTLRWQLLADANKNELKFSTLLLSLWYGYFVNLAIPRLGEISRCTYSTKNNPEKFPIVLASVILERALDVLFLFILLIIVFFLAFNNFQSFIIEQIYTPLKTVIESKSHFLIIALLIIIPLLFIVKKRIKIPEKIKHYLIEIINSWKKLFKLKQASYLLILSGLIWTSYFYTTYIWFLALDSLAGKSNLSNALIVMVIGSIAKSLPIQGGGIGAYHYIVQLSMVNLGYTESAGKLLALLNHGFQLVYTLVLGVISSLAGLFIRK